MTVLTDAPPASPPPLSPFHLTPEQVQFFDDHGYLILRNWVTGDLLTRLQEAGQRWIERGLADGGANTDHLFAQREVGRVMWRVDYVHDKGEPVSLELLGSPSSRSIPLARVRMWSATSLGDNIPWRRYIDSREMGANR
jgi:hypothetical protein